MNEGPTSAYHLTAQLVMDKVGHLMKDLDADQRLCVYVILEQIMSRKIAALTAPVEVRRCYSCERQFAEFARGRDGTLRCPHCQAQ
ncbi:MAG TPA: hypothetical protein VLV17_02020 [Anaeromyxobacteraceae bacterium]|nr:hypothetical protein [Anaeromyxobacteraceae bacterium]